MLNLVGALIAFFLVIFLIRKKCNFGVSLLIGAIVMGLFSLQEIEPIAIPKAFIETSFYSFTNQEFTTGTIELALLLFLIYMLAKTMQESGAIDRLITSLKTLFSKTMIIGIVPAIYGLMPVPGGALFSAPMVEKEGSKIGLSNVQNNYVNIWFRHIWFTIYPVSSAMILLCSTQMFDINIYDLVLIQIPMFVVMIIIGFILLKRFSRDTPKDKKPHKREYSGLIFLIAPIIPLLSSATLMPFGITQTRTFLIGVLISIVFVLIIAKIPLIKWKTILKKGVGWKLPLAIFGIMIFREMFTVAQVDKVLGNAIQNIAIHPLLLFTFIPLFFGVVMGYNLGAIGISFPLLASFLPSYMNGNRVALASLLYIGSFVGYLISPLHLCNVVSSEYMKIDTTQMYRLLIPTGLFILVINTIIMSILL
ncbi:MAG: DUF401 family protein [Candidatus Thermoplasmatota archaeon]|nr:DUF401 family protein [Candidatus Thermoplasmatota archaeon]MBU1941392.1 DUF401 family protein [Candidatus Thermoplasmatota archaeon]